MTDNIFEKKQRLAREISGQRRVNGAIKADKAAVHKLVTRGFVGQVIEAYHNQTVSPILMNHEERLTYLQMWPWAKAKYWWLVFYHWLTQRWQAVQKAIYVRRWAKENKKVTDRMSKGETIEGD